MAKEKAMTKKKTERLPESLFHWQERILAETKVDLPRMPTLPKPTANDEKLVAEIEAQRPWLRLEYLLHETGCKAPCKCRVRAQVTVYGRYRKPERRIVTYREAAA